MNRISDLNRAQHAFFGAGQTRPLAFRRAGLERLRGALREYEPLLLAALREDLGKAEFEGYAAELGMLYGEIDEALRRLKKWARPRRARAPLHQFPARGRIYVEPLGVVLILSPWNYPLLLSLAPLVGAIAAGCCACIKPSRQAPATAQAIGDMLGRAFPEEYVAVIAGDEGTNEALLEERWDHIFFTGSQRTGRKVMEAAARNLTPVTLELGGKSPCIVDSTADLGVAARRIAWGKWLNCGQTCVAPDYCLVHRSALEPFLSLLHRAVESFYGQAPLDCPDYPHIVGERHYARLCGLLEGEELAFGGQRNDLRLQIEPTVVLGATRQSAVMQEEIFGPILPVIPYDSREELEGWIGSYEKPLALYLFTRDREMERWVTGRFSYGGGCINDTVVHLTGSSMPFGGVGASGMGAYHGEWGFLTFSHQKTVLRRGLRPDIQLRYPPYGEKIRVLRKFMK